MSLRMLFALAALCLGGALHGADNTPLPGDSLYHLDVTLTDQDGREFPLASLRGQPVLVAMFYTSCRYICPLIIDSARGVEHALDEAERDGLRIVLVSIDPERDDVAALKRISERRRLDTARWSLVRTDAASVRRLAAGLGVRYRALADGEFNHTSELVLLDADGRRRASSEASGPVPVESFLQATRALLNASRNDPPGD